MMRCAAWTTLMASLGVALEAELLALSLHEFTSTALGAPHWDRRFAQLEAGEELDPSTLACLVMAIAVSRGPAAAAIRLADRVLDSSRFDQPNSVVAGPDRKRADLRGRAVAWGALL